jgi:two-component system, CitB family, sensor kinase
VSRHRTLSSLILRYVLGILVVTTLLGFGLYARVTRDLLNTHNERQALAVAESVAANSTVRSEMATGDQKHLVRQVAEQVRSATGAAYVVVIDANGVRYSHPRPALIGQRITEPVVALDGHTHVGIDPGGLGDSANGKAPLRAPDGKIIGEVSVGFLESAVTDQLWAEIPTLFLYTGAALLAGVGISLVLVRRIKRMTFGLEVDELASLLQEREATLHGIREGVVAFDQHDRLTMVNDEARRLLGLGHARIGEAMADLIPEGRLRDILSGAVQGPDQLILTDEHLLVVNRMPVRVKQRDTGSVVTLRDRTELEALLRELDSVNGLTMALRAQQHEFSNRLHVLSVLVGMGEYDEAAAYLSEISSTSAAQAEDLRSRIAPPALAAQLLAKITIAAERGITLTVTADSRLDHPGPDPRALLTIVGNLLDNAIEAVADTTPPRNVVVNLSYDEVSRLITVTVTDSGAGVTADLAETVFQDGYTTKAPRGRLQRGLGLALVHRLVSQLGGSIVATPGPGGSFTALLPVVVPAAEAIHVSARNQGDPS